MVIPVYNVIDFVFSCASLVCDMLDGLNAGWLSNAELMMLSRNPKNVPYCLVCFSWCQAKTLVESNMLRKYCIPSFWLGFARYDYQDVQHHLCMSCSRQAFDEKCWTGSNQNQKRQPGLSGIISSRVLVSIQIEAESVIVAMNIAAAIFDSTELTYISELVFFLKQLSLKDTHCSVSRSSATAATTVRMNVFY